MLRPWIRPGLQKVRADCMGILYLKAPAWSCWLLQGGWGTAVSVPAASPPRLIFFCPSLTFSLSPHSSSAFLSCFPMEMELGFNPLLLAALSVALRLP